MRLVYYLWESFYNHEDMVIHLWERFFNHEEVVWILIQYVWSDACFLRIWAVSKTNPHKLIIWSCDILAHAFIVLLSILTAVRLFQIILLWWWFISWFQQVSSHYTLQVSIKAAIMMAKTKLQPASVVLVCFLGCLHVQEQAGLSFPLSSKLMASLEGSCFFLLMESHLDLPMLWT